MLAKDEWRVWPQGQGHVADCAEGCPRVNGHRRDVRIIETRCMGICPKKAVTALNASRPGRILTIPKGTATDEAMAQLMSEAE